MALKAYEAYICHNEFSVDELPQNKDVIIKSASRKEADDWWDYATEIECYRKDDVDKRIAELEAENAMLKENRRLRRLLWHAIALFCARSCEYFNGIMSHCLIGQDDLYRRCEEKKRLCPPKVLLD